MRPRAPAECIKVEFHVRPGYSAFIGCDLDGVERVRVELPDAEFVGTQSYRWAGAIHRYLVEEFGAIAKPRLRAGP
jgi:hypothetical protein